MYLNKTLWNPLFCMINNTWINNSQIGNIELKGIPEWPIRQLEILRSFWKSGRFVLSHKPSLHWACNGHNRETKESRMQIWLSCFYTKAVTGLSIVSGEGVLGGSFKPSTCSKKMLLSSVPNLSSNPLASFWLYAVHESVFFFLCLNYRIAIGFFAVRALKWQLFIIILIKGM